MNVVAHTGHEDHAVVYIMEDASGRKLECVESVQPPLSRMDKWVLLVSTLFGCPVGCPMCDAGGGYRGAPDADAIMAQIDYMVDRRFPGRTVPSKQFKIQFARMGEPCLNPAVLEVLRELPRRFNAPGLIPSVSTIAPAGCGPFLDSLKDLKDSLYSGGQFQLQFSIHSTDPDIRRRLIPVNTLNFEDLARFGQRFFQPGDRKITLNFALADHQPVDPDILRRHFPPDRFLIKLTPLNPTFRAEANRMRSAIDPENPTGSL
nr:radical SAM protein [bacterium]